MGNLKSQKKLKKKRRKKNLKRSPKPPPSPQITKKKLPPKRPPKRKRRKLRLKNESIKSPSIKSHSFISPKNQICTFPCNCGPRSFLLSFTSAASSSFMKN